MEQEFPLVGAGEMQVITILLQQQFNLQLNHVVGLKTPFWNKGDFLGK